MVFKAVPILRVKAVHLAQVQQVQTHKLLQLLYRALFCNSFLRSLVM